MISFRFLVLLLSGLLLVGCGRTNIASVKGKVIENGQPRTFEANQAAVQLTLVAENGELDNIHAYTAVVEADGSFEVVASGGEVKVGKYQVAIIYRGNDPKYEALYAPGSQLRREIKGGPNEIMIDLAKPQG